MEEILSSASERGGMHTKQLFRLRLFLFDEPQRTDEKVRDIPEGFSPGISPRINGQKETSAMIRANPHRNWKYGGRQKENGEKTGFFDGKGELI